MLRASGHISHIMCRFKYTHHSCGHTLLKLEEPNDPSCKLCVPVLVALTCYPDQPTQICVENSFQQPPIWLFRSCRLMVSCELCVPVLVALTCCHDQPTQICIDNSFQQPPTMPRPCRPIGPESFTDGYDIILHIPTHRTSHILGGSWVSLG